MDKELLLAIYGMIKEHVLNYQIIYGFIGYSVLEYYLGRTDKVKEGSVLEFTWARIKGLFPASKGIPDNENRNP